jgi:ankyrin repeat protein
MRAPAVRRSLSGEKESSMTLRQILLALLVYLLAFTAAAAEKEAGAVQAALFLNQGEGFVPVGQNETLRTLLESKPQLDFFETAALGATAELKRQLDADPSLITARTKFGWTALHMAAFAGNVDNAKLLLERGADIRARAKNKFRNTPLQVALLTGEYGTAKLLLDRGADPLDRQAKGFTPMHEAAFLGRIDLIKLLLDQGAEVNPRADDGRTPLFDAIRGKHSQAAEFLKSKGAIEKPKEGNVEE